MLATIFALLQQFDHPLRVSQCLTNLAQLGRRRRAGIEPWQLAVFDKRCNVENPLQDVG